MNAARTLALLFVLAVPPPHGLGSAYAQGATATPAAVAALAGQHPAEYYKRAGELFKEGKKDEAVFVLYLGQLHYRTYLLTHREPDQDQSLGTFAALSEQIGKPITQYAFGNIPALARTIDAVLAYDAANPDDISSPPESPDAHEEVRKGLVAMKAKMLSEADRIHAQREKNGLENRQ
jgi:hypothetical protein